MTGAQKPAPLVRDQRQVAMGDNLAEEIRAIARLSGGVRSALVQQPLRVVFFCDTTGSMHPFFMRVADAVREITKRLSEERVGVEFSVYAYKNHGDEESMDGQHPFLVQPFTSDQQAVVEFVRSVRRGGGGDGLCAIEDAFHHLNADLRHEHSRARLMAIVIGDMPAHGVLDGRMGCAHGYDYQVEVMELHRRDVTVHSVFCAKDGDESARRKRVRRYFEWLASTTKGKYFDLDDTAALIDVLLGVCMKEVGRLEAFLQELAARPTISPATQRIMRALKAP